MKTHPKVSEVLPNQSFVQILIDEAMQRINQKPLFNAECIVARGLSLFADKWSMLVLLSLMQGTKRYSELQRNIPDVSPKMLTQTLRSLETAALITRKIYPEVPPRVEYALTEFGASLNFPLAALLRWSIEQEESITSARASKAKKTLQSS